MSKIVTHRTEFNQIHKVEPLYIKEPITRRFVVWEYYCYACQKHIVQSETL